MDTLVLILVSVCIGAIFGATLRPIIMGLWTKFTDWLSRKTPQ